MLRNSPESSYSSKKPRSKIASGLQQALFASSLALGSVACNTGNTIYKTIVSDNGNSTDNSVTNNSNGNTENSGNTNNGDTTNNYNGDTGNSDSTGEVDTGDTAEDDSGTGAADTAETGVIDTAETGLIDTAETGVIDTAETGVIDTAETGVIDTGETAVIDTAETGSIDTSDTASVDTGSAVDTGSVIDTSGSADTGIPPVPTPCDSDDEDCDGLSDSVESILGTDPSLEDTDGDGLSDYDEFIAGTDPLVSDSDSDGLTDSEEETEGTDALDSDSDDDGLTDGDEVDSTITDPASNDTDGDLFTDGFEDSEGTNPNDASDTPDLTVQITATNYLNSYIDTAGAFHSAASAATQTLPSEGPREYSMTSGQSVSQEVQMNGKVALGVRYNGGYLGDVKISKCVDNTSLLSSADFSAATCVEASKVAYDDLDSSVKTILDAAPYYDYNQYSYATDSTSGSTEHFYGYKISME